MEGREEMEPGIDIEEQPESPLLIAMKGHSSSNKSKIAQELAQFLNFPLIDEEDIIPALHDSLETEHCDDFVFWKFSRKSLQPSSFWSSVLSSTLSSLTAPTLTGWLSLQVSQVLVLFSLNAAIKTIRILITMMLETSQSSTSLI